MGELDGSKSWFIYRRLNIRFQFVTDFPAGRVLYTISATTKDELNLSGKN